MRMQAEHCWTIGDCLGCLTHHHPELEKQFLSLLLMSQNGFAFEHLNAMKQSEMVSENRQQWALVKALMLFQDGQIKESAEWFNTIDSSAYTDGQAVAGKGWRDFFTALHKDLAYIFSEANRSWVEGYKLMAADSLQPICLVGDSHVLSAGWGFGSNWFSRPFYVPGLQMRELADPFPNRYKSGFEVTVHSINRATHIVVSVGEIDYRYTKGRAIGIHQRFNPPQIESGEQLDRILQTEIETIRRAIVFLKNCFSPWQHVSLLSIQRPQLRRLKDAELSDECITREYELIDTLNSELNAFCRDVGFNVIDADFGLTDIDWYADGVHKSHAAHKRWVQKYVDTFLS